MARLSFTRLKNMPSIKPKFEDGATVVHVKTGKSGQVIGSRLDYPMRNIRFVGGETKAKGNKVWHYKVTFQSQEVTEEKLIQPD